MIIQIINWLVDWFIDWLIKLTMKLENTNILWSKQKDDYKIDWSGCLIDLLIKLVNWLIYWLID